MSLLEEALAEKQPNALRIKTLCREHPGIIAANPALRVRVWSLLLQGEETKDSDDDDDDWVGTPQTRCGEQPVLEADVRRTRAEYEEFRQPVWRSSLQNILHTFCLMHNASYKQGLNEVLAPFVFLLPPSTNGTLTAYKLFECFVYRYLERYFLVEDSLYLFKSFRYFHLLLIYLDPQLAIHLHNADFVPELYSPSWLLTLYSRALPINQVLRLWDFFIAVDDPAFTFFIGLVLVMMKRTQILTASPGGIPEVLSDLLFHNEEEIDAIMAEAYSLYQQTPTSLRRNLRLCCVANGDLAPKPTMTNRPATTATATAATSGDDEKRKANELDNIMASQSVRTCVMISPREVVSHLTLSSSSTVASSVTSDSPPAPAPSRQSVVIDFRSAAEARETGGGALLGAAVSLEPDFLNSDEFPLWLQHFDKWRHHNIVIVDSPPVKATNMALLKRLIFGEGDGNGYANSFRYGAGLLTANSDAGSSDSPVSRGGRSHRFSWSQRDKSSPFAHIEAAAVADDNERPGILLARILQSDSYKYVSVIDRGFPALVEHLIATRGTTEGYLDNFNRNKWVKYLKTTGRLDGTFSSLAGGRSSRSELIASNANNEFPEFSENYFVNVSDSERSVHQQLQELSETARLELSLIVARRLGHTRMEAILLKKQDRARKEAVTSSLVDMIVDSHMASTGASWDTADPRLN